jgi:DNA-binding NtrC family response regulator
MSSTANGGNAHALVRDDDYRAREFADGVQETSPTPRSAAYDADIELTGRSQAFVETLKQVDLVSHTNLPVLLTGEPGAGQELIAAAIHQRSERSDQLFVVINCATIPAESVDATLFGNEERKGLIEEASGGTVFLDEITQTSPSQQLNLVRLLQTGEFDRAGSSETQKVDVRVIAASSCNLEQEVASGRFSKELFDALSAASIALPPLLDHHEAISPTEPVNDDWVTLSEIEGRYVARVLVHTRGNKQAAARVLSVDRKTLDRMIKRHHIDCQHAKALRAKASARN